MNGRIVIAQFGDILKYNWNQLPENYPNIELDVFTIMPNHIHGILFIQNTVKGGETRRKCGTSPPLLSYSASCRKSVRMFLFHQIF